MDLDTVEDAGELVLQSIRSSKCDDPTLSRELFMERICNARWPYMVTTMRDLSPHATEKLSLLSWYVTLLVKGDGVAMVMFAKNRAHGRTGQRPGTVISAVIHNVQNNEVGGHTAPHGIDLQPRRLRRELRFQYVTLQCRVFPCA